MFERGLSSGCELSYQPLHSQSPQRKRKEKKRKTLTSYDEIWRIDPSWALVACCRKVTSQILILPTNDQWLCNCVSPRIANYVIRNHAEVTYMHLVNTDTLRYVFNQRSATRHMTSCNLLTGQHLLSTKLLPVLLENGFKIPSFYMAAQVQN